MVVVGALAAVPQVRDFVTSAATAVTGGQGPAAHQPGSDQVASDAGGNAESFNVQTYRPRHAGGRASAPPAGSTTNSHVATHTPTHRHAPHRSSPATQPSSTSPSSPSPSAPKTTTGSHSVPKCTGTAGMLPENYAAIVDFLVARGYTDFAAAGIAGNIYQESKGDPESEGMGGGGLIGWTPLPSGLVTGNPATDLQTQLSAILTFNQGWASYIPALNAAATPAAAADIYVTDFERAGIPAASEREASAEAVATACGL